MDKVRILKEYNNEKKWKVVVDSVSSITTFLIPILWRISALLGGTVALGILG